MDRDRLVEYRVKIPGLPEGWTLPMDPEEITNRRADIRYYLKGTEFEDSYSDEQLDRCRLLPQPGGSYLFEDPDGYMYYIRGKNRTPEEGEFRKKRAMIPFEFLNITGADFKWRVYDQDVEPQKAIVNSFVLRFEEFRKNGMGVYIYSAEKGSGKTMLACCLLNEIASKYAASVKFINAMDLLELTKQTYKGRDPDELQELYDAAVLAIDDIGVQMSREWIDATFYRLINTRYDARRVTIYTSNLKADKLKMDERTIDRILSTTIPLHLPEVPIRSNDREKQINEFLSKLKGPSA